jgi:hypothetical protein
MATSKKKTANKKPELELTSARLKKQLKNGQAVLVGPIYLRLHRALSWLKAAEQTEQVDERFIFLWIAFNACYANELADLSKTKTSESSAFSLFIKRVIQHDDEKKIYKLLWVRYSQEIRLLLDNPFIFKQFWEYVQDEKTAAEFQLAFDASKRACEKAIGKGNAVYVLIELLRRLYTLRNQVFHGGATYMGTVNRKQLIDASAILMRLVPAIIEIMIVHKELDWGRVMYPPINVQ